MPYAPTTTFNVGDSVESLLVQENLNEIKEYLNGGIVAGDIATDAWVRTNHIVRGHYNPLTQQLQFVSGVVGGKNFSVLTSELGFLPDAPTAGNAPSVPTLVYQPNTTFDFYLPQDAYVMFQVYMSPIAISNIGTGSAGDEFVWRIYVDDSEQTYTEFKTQWISSAPRKEKAFLNTFWAGELAAGEHTISIKGYAEAPYAIIAAWGISLETWHKN